MAISMISHYPDRKELVTEMADLAIEELSHYKEVIKVIHERGNQLGADSKDAYVIGFRTHFRDGKCWRPKAEPDRRPTLRLEC